MKEEMIYIKSLSAPQVDRREVLRYAGVREPTDEQNALLDECIFEAEKLLKYSVCYRIYDIEIDEREIDLGFAKTTSRSLIKNLAGCEKIILFCATIGIEMDRLILKHSHLSLAKAVLLQALGSERVEALCDAFCEEMKIAEEKEGRTLTKRFSPGYGDLPLDLQADIFASLDCTRRIGVALSNDMFMTPSKSVTAIIGIKM